MGRNVRVYVDGGDVLGIGLAVGFVALIFSCIGAWLTHIVWVIGKLASDGGVTAGQIVLGLLGFFMPPIGVVHGFMIWFGAGMA